ncbi:MAG: glycosyltransferase family 4 protein [Candidatus Omnitrophica bacterium]|nr:glycosyltransferase family 4 protein [Candidatus Omnitrophota bacterium]
MKILFLLPQPFYQERGSPIDAHLAIRAMSERGDSVDVLAFHEGLDMSYPNVRLYRIFHSRYLTNIRPGFSWKKVLCDMLLCYKTIKLMRRNEYDIIHAMEEASFIALLVGSLFRVPFVYDMDSLLSRQLVDKYKYLRPFEGIFRYLESIPIKKAIAVAPVCKALGQEARKLGARWISLWQDISLLHDNDTHDGLMDIRTVHSINAPIIMYIGNLESYQGIDLLIQSFALARKERCLALVIIGGRPDDISKYRSLAQSLGCEESVFFLGPKPTDQVQGYMQQADILVSSRVHGDNTPMKIYTYLHSGIPVLATNLYTHTQVVTTDIAYLAEPRSEEFSRGMLALIEDKELQRRITHNAVAFIEEHHVYACLRDSVHLLYGAIEKELS